MIINEDACQRVCVWGGGEVLQCVCVCVSARSRVCACVRVYVLVCAWMLLGGFACTSGESVLLS